MSSVGVQFLKGYEMILSHIGSTQECGVVLKLERFSHLSGRSFRLGSPIGLETNGLDQIGKWKDLYKLYVLSPLCGKSLGMNLLDTCDSIGEIVSLSKKNMFFFYYCTKKIFSCK